MDAKSLNAHIETLEERHEALDKQIAARAGDAVYDDMQLNELKRQKLQLKDEIEQCKTRLQG